MNFHIEQIYDKGLAQASYIIHSQQQAAIIDPERDENIYLDYCYHRNSPSC